MAADLNDQRARRELNASTVSEPAAGCGARDLKGLLDQIAAQIGDADRRHSTALRDMQSRLTGLSHTAASARASAPADAVSAIDRIEGEISALASRVAAADRELSLSTSAADPTPVDDPWTATDAEALANIYDPAPAAAPAYDPEMLPVAAILPRGPIVADAPATDDGEAADDAPAAAEPAVARDQLALAPLSAVLPMDNFPIIDDAPAIAPATEADADTILAAPAPAAAVESTLSTDRSWLDERLAAVAERVELSLARGQTQEKDWLEGRLAEVASRIEQQLAVLRPDSSLLQLSEHIDQVEKRLGASLAGAARRTDVEGLAAIETQIAALSGDLHRAERHLARLDAVEAEIRAISARVSDERLAAMLMPQQAAASSLDQIDLDRITQAVAGIVATHAPATAATAVADADQVAEIRALLETVMIEQRQADEQTASVLDTMQHALIGLLDRMDAIEQQPAEAQVQAPAFAPSYAPAAAFAPMASAEELVDAPAPDEPPHVSLEDYVPHPVPAPHLAPEPAFRSAPRSEPVPAAPVIEEPAVEAAPAVAQSAAADKPAARKEEPARDEFIAAARRAMRQAQAKAAAEEAERAAAAPAAKTGTGKSLRKNILSGLGRSTSAAVLDEQPAAAPAAKIDRRVVVAAIAAVMIAGAGYQYYRLQTSAMPGPIAAKKIERQLVTPQTIERERAEAQAQNAPSSSQSTPSPSRAPAPAADRTGPGAQPAQPENATGKRGSRPLPEALVDELSGRQEETAPRQTEQRDARLDLPPDLIVPGAGITIQQSPGVPTPNEFRRFNDRQTIARLSNQLSRISNPGTPIASVMPAAVVPEDSRIEGDVVEAPLSQVEPAAASGAAPSSGTGATASTGAAQPAGQVVAARTGEMPPATVGPLSMRLAAQAGDPSAEFEVAARMAEGRGMPQDFKQAVVWYERSATRGFAPAQYRLASMYERGLGATADLDAAKLWYKRAADQGHVKAMHNLAVLIAGTTSGSPDYPAAAQWFQLAADYGLGDSQFNLAVLYESGLGVPRDTRLAYKWLSLSARAGDAQALKRKTLVRAKIDAADATRIDEEVEGWKARQSSRLINDARAAGEAWKVRSGQQQAISG